MKILILGGTRDALEIAHRLIKQHEVIYSIVGIVRQPDLNCQILSGGFSTQQTENGEKTFTDGAAGLKWYLQQSNCDLLIDATHPYASQISCNAVKATDNNQVTLLRYDRPAWESPIRKQPTGKEVSDDSWIEYDTLDALLDNLKKFRKPFFSIGRSILSATHLRTDSQQWVIRSAGLNGSDLETVGEQGILHINALGPFHFEDELALFKKLAVDALVTKNSGGQSVSAKLAAAKHLNIPILMLARPEKPAVRYCFSTIDALIEKINNSLVL